MEDTAAHTPAVIAVGLVRCSAGMCSSLHRLGGQEGNSALRRNLEVVEDMHSSGCDLLVRLKQVITVNETPRAQYHYLLQPGSCNVPSKLAQDAVAEPDEPRSFDTCHI